MIIESIVSLNTDQEQPALELLVSVYNINLGHNTELLDACHLLKEYAQYVEQIRIFAGKLPFAEAVECAVTHCINNGILADFLSQNRAEAIAMSIFEYNEEKHMKSEREEWHKIGLEEGQKRGEERLAQLMQALLSAGKNEDIRRILSDLKYREQLYAEYHIL